MSVFNFKRITPLPPLTISMVGPHLTSTIKGGETINLPGETNNAKPIKANNLPTPTINHKTSKIKTHQTNNVTNDLISDKTYQTTKPLFLNPPLKKLSDPYNKKTRSLRTSKGEPKLNYPPTMFA
ncbi:hypothetical protein PIB30_054101 [Stylosanthes scabra]|uniref:Uncharacterized protein n=1 Tax=Stylosanthes scabra TaxID=79078 RepID=A0ABU6RJB9_9FABA|nr:hypothetical protein [Stylosanthes scabra]